MAGQTFGFERADDVGFLQSQCDVIKPVQQAMFAERLDIKGQLTSVFSNHDLPGQVYAQLVAHESLDLFKQARHLRSEGHTSELQQLMRISSTCICLKNKH